MSTIFLVFLSMLAAFLLLTLAAAMRSVWQLFARQGVQPQPLSPKPREASKVTDFLLLIGVATAWYSVAGGWIVQLTIYPIYADFAPLGAEAFHAFSRGYLSRIAIPLLPIGVMCLAWVLLLWLPSRYVPRRTVWAIVILCVGFVAITPFAAIAQDQMFDHGFSDSLYARLMWSNAIRAVLFTAIGLLSLAALRSRWATRSNHEPGA
jgi:hypothetical protein